RARRLFLHDRGDEPRSVELHRVELGFGVRNGRRDGGRGHARQRSPGSMERRYVLPPRHSAGTRPLRSPARDSPTMPDDATPPVAARIPNVLRAHGDERIDDWFWLRERANPDVRAYLEAENAYTDAVMRPTAALQDRIYDEIASRVQQTDASAPVPHGPFEYYHRTVECSQSA